MKNRIVVAGLVALAVACALAAVPAQASSHREAPGITKMPKVDGTDFYMFNSYEPGRAGYVTFLANYVPLQDAYGGPNYFTLDPDAVYDIHVDNTGTGTETTTFRFRVKQRFNNIQLPIGGQLVSIPLVNAGPISAGAGGDAAQNVEESYTIQKIDGPLDGAHTASFVQDADTGSSRFAKPIDNIGHKSIADYPGYAASFIHNITVPGCGVATGRVFVGQRHDGFAVNLGEIFDLVNLSAPLGPRDAQPNLLSDKNVTTFALEVPAHCLTGKSTVIGGWTTASLPRNRVLADSPDFRDANQSGDFVQVSRLGAPLVNELVIGLADKNKFNNSKPKNDAQFAAYVTNPTLPALLHLLFPPVIAPTNFPRKDLIAAFLTGITGLNELGGPAEILRLNTATAAVAPGSQNNLGLLGGDAAGFPNGRRPGDDVVDITLRVAMGVVCAAFPGVYCSPSDAPSGGLPFTDGTLNDVSQFDATFPYLTNPFPGSPNGLGGNGVTK
ncbi:MAG TPA: DUF4331 domain-containing protein [Thermoanaerobaculia bacterium]|nr:DUF4331 domain-containing protein [Thermoanaerobaculia bacterium]